MSGNNFQCCKCGGRMIIGFNVNQSRDHNFDSYFLGIWIEGNPTYEKTIFGGDMDSVELAGKRKFYIRALRCDKCGYLENYAV